MNKWYRFLIKEVDYPAVEINPEKPDEYYTAFNKVFDSNKFFRKSIIDIVLNEVIKPALRTLKRDEFMELKESILEIGNRYISNKYHVIINRRLKKQNPVIANCFGQIGKVLFNDFLNYLFFPRDPVYIKNIEFFSKIFDDITFILFSANKDLIPKIPKLSKANLSLNKTRHLEQNVDLIERYSNFRIDLNLDNDNILNKVKLVRFVGGGAFGKVFETSDGQAFKIFTDSVSLQKDLNRMEIVTRQVYKGKASLEDMHYFDVGNINPELYYALMPMIVPLESSPFFNKSPVFETAIDYALDLAAQRFKYKNFMEFNNLVFEDLYRYSEYLPEGSEREEFLDDMDQYSETIIRILEASYNAVTRFGGQDLHSGNIGYLKQRPDIFFFYDM